jgi:hypothetical protein
LGASNPVGHIGVDETGVGSHDQGAVAGQLDADALVSAHSAAFEAPQEPLTGLVNS